MKRLTVGSLLLVLVSLGGCVVVPAGPPRVYASPVVVVPPPVIGVGVYGGYRR